MDEKVEPGLYIVATPIGNLGDVTRRAVDVLSRVDFIACEDSRVTGKLLNHLGIKRSMVRYDDHSKASDRERLIALMHQQSVALVSDAGTPLISDPGYKLVREARTAGVAITSLPGASAAIVALTLSGLPTDRFYFHGFLPAKSSAKIREIESLEAIKATLVFYESGPRLAATLQAMADIWGPREAAVVREISKKFEETKTGNLQNLASIYTDAPPKGEIVIVVAPPADEVIEVDNAAVEDALKSALGQMSTSKAASYVAKRFGLDRRMVYGQAMALKGQIDDAQTDS
jgi:16S rRNA (cytidine1402-2'-O)-methyltransferase